MRPRAAAVLASLAAACSSPPDAGDAMLAHLASIAPLAVVPDSFTVVDATRAGDTVTFRTLWAFQDTSGFWVDTSAVLTATVEAADDALRVSAYDGALAAHVVELVDEDRRRRYEDLLDAVHHVYHAIVEAGWYYAANGIDPDSLRARVVASGHDMAHPWGVTPVRTGEAQVIWLSDAADPDATCALPITDGDARAADFAWVEDRQWFTCRGRTPDIYSRAIIPVEVRAAMEQNGVMPPAPPGTARGAASHAHD